MSLIVIETGEPWAPDAPINGVRYPLNIETLWSDDDLASIGLARFVPPPLPEPETEPSEAP